MRISKRLYAKTESERPSNGLRQTAKAESTSHLRDPSSNTSRGGGQADVESYGFKWLSRNTTSSSKSQANATQSAIDAGGGGGRGGRIAPCASADDDDLVLFLNLVMV